MAETPSPSQQPPSQPDSTHYWCYQCDKRVSVETQPDHPDVICYECKNGFVESIAQAAREDDDNNNPSFGNEFLQVLRLIAQAAREEDADAPPPPPSEFADHENDSDYLRIELDGWNNVIDDDDDNDNHGDLERNEDEDEDRSDEDEDGEEHEENEDDLRRQRREGIRLRLRDFASRAASRRNRILDWAEILMGLEDHSIEFRLQVPDDYVGNPGDYVDAAGYEALLQNLAETESRIGAPPAAKSAVLGLETVEIKSDLEAIVCAICKDTVSVSEMAKKLPCGHGYHGDCIVPWLGSRNTCPVCRYELATDDPKYEEDRKKRFGDCSSSSGGV